MLPETNHAAGEDPFAGCDVVDVSDEAQDAGFVGSVALSRGVWDTLVLTETEYLHVDCNPDNVRDILWSARCAIAQQHRGSFDTLQFALPDTPDGHRRPQLTLVSSRKNSDEELVTIMFWAEQFYAEQ